MNASVEPARVRVYLPTYRRPTLLPRALASLRAQTMARWVCELHNDDPADPFPAELVARLADPRITLVTHERNLGATATFNLFFQAVAEPISIHCWRMTTGGNLIFSQRCWPPRSLTQTSRFSGPTCESGRNSLAVRSATLAGRFGQSAPSTPSKSSRGAIPRQICGALHSGGAALIRSRPADDFRIPEIPFASIEPFRERMFPHPLMLISAPLANFSVTLHTARSRDPAEWAEIQAMLAATFFLECPWDEARLRRLWDAARAAKPSGATNLILASLAHPAARALRRHARWSDWLVVWRGFVRRPGALFSKILRSHAINTRAGGGSWKCTPKPAGEEARRPRPSHRESPEHSHPDRFASLSQSAGRKGDYRPRHGRSRRHRADHLGPGPLRTDRSRIDP